MKRNLMLVVVLASIALASSGRLTRASNPIPASFTNPNAAAQNPAIFELTDAEIARAQQGLAISPIPVNAGFGKTRLLVGLGSYLVNAVAGCSDCHTNPPFAEGGDPYRGQPAKANTANFLAGGVKFGPFTSRNLTPDPARNNLPAGMTLEQFLHVMHTGEDLSKLHPQISPQLQVMPWPIYAKMNDRDLHAIYLYLSALPRREPAP